MTSPWMRVKEAAEYLHLTEWGVYQAVSDGDLDHTKIRNKLFFKAEWLDEYMEGGRREIPSANLERR
jgi:excisionase family DNA binding protein